MNNIINKKIEELTNELRESYSESRDDVETDHPKGMGCFDNFLVLLKKALEEVQEEAKRDIVKKLTWKPKGEWEENLRDLINT